ncbi:MAG: HEAT repeat domain-containing protein [Planctomycetes bacterium]|nr:HEAT repeat domain-containing protein [Planctomycetota bacterium]
MFLRDLFRSHPIFTTWFVVLLIAADFAARHPAVTPLLATVAGCAGAAGIVCLWTEQSGRALLLFYGAGILGSIAAFFVYAKGILQRVRYEGPAVAAIDTPSSRSVHRVLALYALRRTYAPEDLETFSEFARDPDPAVRRAAIAILGTYRDRRAAPPLVGALEDSDPEIRDLARRGLVRSTGRDLGPDAGAWRAWLETGGA